MSAKRYERLAPEAVVSREREREPNAAGSRSQ
jgi:hypothetical protein